MNPEPAQQPRTLSDILAVLGRRKWAIVLPLLLVPAIALGVSLRQERLYKADSSVLVQLAGTTATDEANRLELTQARLARSPRLATRVLKAAHVKHMTPQGFLARSSSGVNLGTDFIQLSVSSHSSPLAVRLANAYAREFATYSGTLASDSIDGAIAELQPRI